MKTNLLIIAITLSSLGGTSPSMAQESSRAQTIKETLQGQSTSKTRGFVARGAEKQVKTRTLYVSRGGRGAEPKQAFFGDSAATVTEVTAPAQNPNPAAKGDLGVPAGEAAYKVEYKVDPTSQLRGEVFFDKGTAEIRTGTESMAFLNDLATALKDPVLKDHKFVIEGHASAEGSAVTNKYLSQLRANKIHDLLVKYGVNGNQVFPAGFGEDEARFPDGAPEKTLEQDRRVLIYKLEE